MEMWLGNAAPTSTPRPTPEDDGDALCCASSSSFVSSGLCQPGPDGRDPDRSAIIIMMMLELVVDVDGVEFDFDAIVLVVFVRGFSSVFRPRTKRLSFGEF